VHYKEAVCECKCMHLFTAAWELKEITRLCAFIQTTLANSKMEFKAVEEESHWLLDLIVDHQRLGAVKPDAKYVVAVYDRDKKSFH
jgi:transcriptional antiterminator Rof (Rho-off)